MNKPTLIVVAMIALIGVGGLIGYFLGYSLSPPQSLAKPVSAISDAGPLPMATEMKPFQPASSDSSHARTALTPGVYEFDTPAPGIGKITGRVGLQDGTPLAGVTVSAWPEPPDTDLDASQPDFEHAMQQAARYWGFKFAGRTTALTDADGRYELTELGDYQYDLILKAPRYKVISAPNSAYSGDTADFLVEVLCDVRIEVRLEDGSTVSPTNVHAWRGNETEYWCKSDATAELGKGSWTFQAFAGEPQQYATDPLVVDVIPGPAPQTIRLVLKISPGMKLTLKLPEGEEPRNNYEVFLISDPAVGAPSMESLYGGIHRSLWSVFDVDFLELKPGRYRLAVTFAGGVAAWKDIELGMEFRNISFDLSSLNPADFIIVRVLGPEGQPIKFPYATAALRGGDWETSGVQFGDGCGVRRADGTIWIRRAQGEPGAEWWYDLSARGGEFLPSTLRYEVSDTYEVEIRLTLPATAKFVFEGLTDSPWSEHFSASLQHVTNNGRTRSHVNLPGGYGESLLQRVTDDTLIAEQMGPGRYELSLRCIVPPVNEDERHYVLGGKVAVVPFELVPGENTVQCPVPDLYDLTLVIDDAAAIKWLRLDHPTPWIDRSVGRRALKSRVVVKAIPAGDWTIRNDIGDLTVTVSKDVEIDLLLQLYEGMRVSQIKRGGDIEKLGLRNRDFLVAIDNQRVANTRMLRSQYDACLEQEVTTWRVIRGGEQQDITFDGTALRKLLRDAEGGDLDDYVTLTPSHQK